MEKHIKAIITAALLILALLMTVSCAKIPENRDNAGNAPDIDITESMYVTYINEIYTNYSKYSGQTIRIEGMFAYEEYNGNRYYYVYRTGPGCCGNDGNMCGFEFTWDEIDSLTPNDWIEVTGKLRIYEEEGYTYLTLDAESVVKPDARGAEVVGNL